MHMMIERKAHVDVTFDPVCTRSLMVWVETCSGLSDMILRKIPAELLTHVTVHPKIIR